MERHSFGKMKKRRLHDLDSSERIAVAKLYLSGSTPMATVASKHHINAQLVGRICKDYKLGGSQLEKRKTMEAQDTLVSDAIAQVVDRLLGRNRPIWSAATVAEELVEHHQLDIPAAVICKRMRKELGLGYKKVSSIPVQANSERCLVLR